METKTEIIIKHLRHQMNEFLDDLRCRGIDDVISSTYEISVKEEIICLFEYDFFEEQIEDDEQFVTSLLRKGSLDELFSAWIDFDDDHAVENALGDSILFYFKKDGE